MMNSIHSVESPSLMNSPSYCKTSLQLPVTIYNNFGSLKIIELMKDENFDPSIDSNSLFRTVVRNRDGELMSILLRDKRVASPELFQDLVCIEMAIGYALDNKDLNLLLMLLKNQDLITKYGSIAMTLASQNGDLEFLQSIITELNVDPSIERNEAINHASYHGNYKVVDFLLQDPRVNPADRSNSAIIFACRNNHKEVVRILLADPRVNPSDRNNLALRHAVYFGNADIVELLMKHKMVDPTDCENDAIRLALSKKNMQIVFALLKDEKVRKFVEDNVTLKKKFAQSPTKSTL